MYTDVATADTGLAVPEGFLDAMVATLAAIHDLLQSGTVRNSRTGSVYVVKPKLHGSAEVQMTLDLFAPVEDALGLETNTIKLGIIDDDRLRRQCLREREMALNFGTRLSYSPTQVDFNQGRYPVWVKIGRPQVSFPWTPDRLPIDMGQGGILNLDLVGVV